MGITCSSSFPSVIKSPGIPKTSAGGHEVKTIFKIIQNVIALSHPPSLASALRSFSKGFQICDDIILLLTDVLVYSCVLKICLGNFPGDQWWRPWDSTAGARVQFLVGESLIRSFVVWPKMKKAIISVFIMNTVNIAVWTTHIKESFFQVSIILRM